MATFKPILFTVTLAILAAVSSAAPNNHKELSLTVPDECKGKGFCNIKPKEYDEMQALVDSLLTPTFIAQNLGDRSGDRPQGLSPESDWHNCPTRRTVFESSYVFSSSNESQPDYIIQHKLLRQPIENIECAYDKIDVDSSEQCFKDLGLSTFNMKSRCESSKAMRSLLVLDYKTKQLMKKSYDIPCCCTCKVERN